MASKAKTWHPATAIFFSVLVSVFVVIGMPVLGEALVKILPTTKSQVRVLESEMRTSASIQRGHSSNSYFIKVQYADGQERSIFCLKKIHLLVGRSSLPQDATLGESLLFSKPVSIDYPSQKNPGETETHTLLAPNTFLLVAGSLCWGIVGYLLIKLPNKKQFPWLIFSPLFLGAIALGIRWWI